MTLVSRTFACFLRHRRTYGYGRTECCGESTSSTTTTTTTTVAMTTSKLFSPAVRHYQATAVTEDVLLFKDDRVNFYRFMSFGTTMMAAIAFYNGHGFYKSTSNISRGIDEAKSSIELDRSTLWRRYKAFIVNLVSGNGVRYGVTGIMVGFGVLSLLIAIFLPRRVVHRMSLLRGGSRVSITTFGSFGVPRKRTFRVGDVTSSRARQSHFTSIGIKVKGVRTTFRVDMESGKFLNAPLFDDVASRQVVFKK